MVVAIIPARAGSKGIEGKNMRLIAEKPLLEWTIEHAKDARSLNKVIVSTEDEGIGVFAEANGAEWWKRPSELATDEASTLSVLYDVVSGYPSKIDTVVLLQPTSPIRSKGLIDRCVDAFRKHGFDSLATGFLGKCAPYGAMQHYRRQDFKGDFYDDGNIYVIKADILRSNDRIGKKIGGVVISREENLEVDDMMDMKIVGGFLSEPMDKDTFPGLARGTKFDVLEIKGKGESA